MAKVEYAFNVIRAKTYSFETRMEEREDNDAPPTRIWPARVVTFNFENMILECPHRNSHRDLIRRPVFSTQF